MIILLFILAIIAVLILTIHVTVELNALEKSVSGIVERTKKRYEGKRSSTAGQ